MNSDLLKQMTLVDTPGVLAGAKYPYHFPGVVEWFVNRSDRVLVFFDAHKLDISDTFKQVLSVLKDKDEKVRIVLNKADTVTVPNLLRVYGSLMWSLGKVFDTPEACRVYIGSFWDKPVNEEQLKPVFDSQLTDLVSDIKRVPGKAMMRKLNMLLQ